MASQLPPPPDPYLETAAKELAEATDPHPRIYEVPPAQGRDILAGLQSGEGVERPEVDEEWVTVDAGQWGQVRTRIIRPKGATGPLPVVFYIHGAGWVFGDENTHDRLFRELTVGAGAAGVFPVYDRAPEAQYPTQVEQNYAVGQWVLQHGAEHGLDTSRIAVTGESVGGDGSSVGEVFLRSRSAGDPNQSVRHEHDDDEYVHDFCGRTVEIVVVFRDELADLVDEQAEPDAAEHGPERAQRRADERQQHDHGERHPEPAPQHVRDVQVPAADLRVPRRGEEEARDEHGRDRDDEERHQVPHRGGVPGDAEAQRAAPPGQPGGSGARALAHRLRFSRTRTLISMGVPSKPNVSRRRRSMNRR